MFLNFVINSPDWKVKDESVTRNVPKKITIIMIMTMTDRREERWQKIMGINSVWKSQRETKIQRPEGEKEVEKKGNLLICCWYADGFLKRCKYYHDYGIVPYVSKYRYITNSVHGSCTKGREVLTFLLISSDFDRILKLRIYTLISVFHIKIILCSVWLKIYCILLFIN